MAIPRALAEEVGRDGLDKNATNALQIAGVERVSAKSIPTEQSADYALD